MRLTIVLLILLFGACGTPYPNVPLAPPHVYLLGEQALQQGEYLEAEGHFTSYLESGRQSYRARALYQLARTRYQMEDYRGAASALDTLDQEFPGFGPKQTAALHGDLMYASGNRVDAILLWEEAYAHSTESERATLRPRIQAAMTSISDEEANDLARALSVPDVYEMAIDRLAGPVEDDGTWELEDGTQLAAVGYDDKGEVVADVPTSPAIDSAAELSADGDAVEEGSEEIVVANIDDEALEESEVVETTEVTGPRGKIACLLPLTGPARGSGHATLDALRQAFPNDDLIVRDSGSGIADVRTLVRELGADSEVIALIGPMQSDTIAAAKTEAGKAGLPILPLTTKVTSSNDSGDAAALATYAVQTMHLSRIGIIAPQGGSGDAFAETAAKLGATIIGAHHYDPEGAYLASTLSAVQGWIDGGGVDAVYIPDTASRAAEIATAGRAVSPELALLGNAGWNMPEVLQASAPTIEGAVITASASSMALNAQIDAAAAALERAQAAGASRSSAADNLANLGAASPTGSALLRIADGAAVSVLP